MGMYVHRPPELDVNIIAATTLGYFLPGLGTLSPIVALVLKPTINTCNPSIDLKRLQNTCHDPAHVQDTADIHAYRLKVGQHAKFALHV